VRSAAPVLALPHVIFYFFSNVFGRIPSGLRKLCTINCLLQKKMHIDPRKKKKVPGVALVQIFLAIGALEIKMHNGKIARSQIQE
jgi:hypothetical protein